MDDDGYVTEGGSTNAWIVDGAGKVVTRDLSNAILPGVTRRIILEAVRDAGMDVVERKFTIAEAQKADFVRRAFVDLHSLPVASAAAIERAAMAPPRSVKCIIV